MAWFTPDWFSLHHMVRCAHKSGYVINFITVACRISSRLKWYKNYKNRLRLARVIVKNKMSRFFMFTVYKLWLRHDDSDMLTSRSSLQPQFSLTILLCLWSDTRHYGHFNRCFYLLTYMDWNFELLFHFIYRCMYCYIGSVASRADARKQTGDVTVTGCQHTSCVGG